MVVLMYWVSDYIQVQEFTQCLTGLLLECIIASLIDLELICSKINPNSLQKVYPPIGLSLLHAGSLHTLWRGLWRLQLGNIFSTLSHANTLCNWQRPLKPSICHQLLEILQQMGWNSLTYVLMAYDLKLVVPLNWNLSAVCRGSFQFSAW